MDMVMALWPKPDNKKKQVFVRSAMAKLNEVGLVGIHDAGVTPGNLELYKTLARGDDFTVRVYASMDLTLCARSYHVPGDHPTLCPQSFLLIYPGDDTTNTVRCSD